MNWTSIRYKLKSHTNKLLYRVFDLLGRRWFTHVVYSYNGDIVDGITFARDMNALVKLRKMKLRPGKISIRS